MAVLTPTAVAVLTPMAVAVPVPTAAVPPIRPGPARHPLSVSVPPVPRAPIPEGVCACGARMPGFSNADGHAHLRRLRVLGCRRFTSPTELTRIKNASKFEVAENYRGGFGFDEEFYTLKGY